MRFKKLGMSFLPARAGRNDQVRGSAIASMESPTTFDSGSSTAAAERYLRSGNPHRPAAASVSAGIAAANLLSSLSSDGSPRFPGEDGGRSLTEIARGDLDAALQLLADRAQYITGASGAAIALRRGEHADMLCRASSGMNAPELGALLSMEYGLSGESVRTGRALRCDDVENDPRVNRAGCRELGIASVAIMPITSERQVLGVFELFSGKPHAFDERDVSALQRLGEMVEVAVKQAVAAQGIPALPEVPHSVSNPPEARVGARVIASTQHTESRAQAGSPSAGPALSVPARPAPAMPEKPLHLQKEEKAEPVSSKPLFWSAAVRAQGSADRPDGQARETAPQPVIAPLAAVPPVLRRLEKCQACGFPVSPGRTFCVECEEKQWRGQRLPQSGVENSRELRSERRPDPRDARASVVPSEPSASTITLPVAVVGEKSPSAIAVRTIQVRSAAETPAFSVPEQTLVDPTPAAPTELAAAEDSALFLSSIAPPQSWFAANKYVVGALLVLAIVISAIVWLR